MTEILCVSVYLYIQVYAHSPALKRGVGRGQFIMGRVSPMTNVPGERT